MTEINKDDIISVLKQCYDPEIPIDLWNLGLIYDIKIKNSIVDIVMSLTTPGCTMGQYMADDIKSKLEQIQNIENVNVEVVFDPPWKPEMMTDEGRQKLGFSPTESNQKSEKKDWE
tara:strand:+ start:242 stop:589 length:348 start_codon:yes stop_codon:yes gene_type:complete